MSKMYAVMRVEKLKTAKDFKDAYCHNFRIYNVENADKLRKHLNIEAYDHLNGKTYEEAVEETIRDLKMKGTIDKNIRKDAIRGMEIVLRYSPEAVEHISQEEWIEKNIQWLKDTFNIQMTYTDENGVEHTEQLDNLKHVWIHNDEGIPHIHAFVIPIDDKGHLNYQYFFGGRDKMSEKQDSYAEAMKEFGLERGEYRSTATAEEITRYYEKLKEAVNARMPYPNDGEPVEEYFARVNNVYQTEKVHHRDEIVKLNQEHIADKAQLRIQYEAQLRAAYEERKKLKKVADIIGMDLGEAFDQELEDLQERIERIDALEDAVESMPDDIKEMIYEKQNEILRARAEERERREQEKEERRKKKEKKGKKETEEER